MKILFLVLCTVFVLALAIPSDGKFSYDKDSPSGPSNWVGFCQNGTKQSPIKISSFNSTVDPQLPVPLNVTYANQSAILINNGFGPELEVDFGNFTPLRVGGKTYVNTNVHFHFPSEHLIDGIRYLLEMHIVHTTAEDDIAVIGVLFTLGHPSAFLSQFFNLIHEVADENSTGVPIANLAPPTTELFGHYARYNGSLTVPPCTEGVVWTIPLQPATLSAHQLLTYIASFPEPSARPVQPLNGRIITKST